jgi:hypothetical protein
MNGSVGPDTFWLDFVNIGLGLVVLLCVLLVAFGVVRELRYRLALRGKTVDDHAFETPELGVTMADGGKRVDRR